MKMKKVAPALVGLAIILTGCTKPDSTPRALSGSAQIEKILLHSHADKVGANGVAVKLTDIQRSASVVTVGLRSEDGHCRYSVTGHEGKGGIDFDPSVAQVCDSGSRSNIVAWIVPQNNPKSLEPCKQNTDAKERLLCFARIDHDNRELTLVIDKTDGISG